MKIFVLSDIHGDLNALEKAIAIFDQEKADLMLLLGDLLYHGPRNPLPIGYNPSEVAKLLNTKKSSVLAVRGNCDSEVDQMLIEFPMMSNSSQLFVDGKRIFVTHGHLTDLEEDPLLQNMDLVLFGHIHLPIATKSENFVLGNPGSCSLPKENNPASYAMIENNTFTVYNLVNREILAQAQF